VCDELERAFEVESASDVVVNAAHLRCLVEDARTLRGLIEAGIPGLANRPPPESPGCPIETLQPIHHQLAQLLAQGRSDTEVAQITGRSPASIATLKSDPTFAQLVADYQEMWELRTRQPGKPDSSR